MKAYAILSHRWRPGEVTFQDCDGISNITMKSEIKAKPGYKKLVGACTQALKDGLTYVWVDTCCIDKSSSADWYELSRVCYAYMDEVTYSADPRARDSQFQNSSWFNRGWTLQELVAPTEVVFFDAAWRVIGTKAALADLIARITRIDERVLMDGMYAHQTNVAEKMSWAAGRRTTKQEDRAYSLLGIFGVNMPTLYGEGSRAFRRLQLQIIQIMLYRQGTCG
ncbi:HET-domain-containing protein [Aspergillus ambiguus]|uniref:HET-domain-containing protein n=1 Tax=Aspergillus ambiguus TaxID=176160 RepID=UPI003CCCBA4E